MTKFETDSQRLVEQFEKSAAELSRTFKAQRQEMNEQYQSKKNVLARLHAGIIAEQDERIEKEGLKADEGFSEQIDQVRQKCEEIKHSMEDIEKDKIAIIEKGDESIARLKADHEKAMREANTAHEKEMDLLNARLRQKQTEIYAADERISDLKHQLMVGQTAYQTEALAMKNSLSTFHQLKISQQNALACDHRAKIDVTRQKLKSVKVVLLDSYSGHFEHLQREIDNIVAARPSLIEEAARTKRVEFEQTIVQCHECLKELGSQIAESLQRSQTSLMHFGHELKTCVETLEEKNAAEVSAVQDESKRVLHYLANVQVEWDCLRDSTQRIYTHYLTEFGHDLRQVEITCEADLRRLAEEHQPVPDPTDYMAVLRDELPDMEMSFRVDEANVEHQKMLILNDKVEEEHQHGIFQALRQNVK
jgi:hypothetical protein